MTNPHPRRKFLRNLSSAAIASAASVVLPRVADAKPTVGTPATIPNSEEFLLPGPGDRSLRIQVSHPYSDDPTLSLPIKGRKPVPIYIMDGGLTFGLFSTITRYMQWGGELPPCLVVGIGYEDEKRAYDSEYRLYDLTPPDPHWSGWPSSTEKNGKPQDVGGGPAFREFLTSTLRPLIEERYEVDPSDSVLFGHSLGGLFVFNTLLEMPTAFRNFLALSPSLWFDDNRALRMLESKLDRTFELPGNLAVYVGEREERIAPPVSRMTSNVLEVARLVAEHRSSFGRVTVRVLPNESHHTILGNAVAQGLRFLLSPESKRAESY